MAEKFHADLKTTKKEAVQMAVYARDMLRSAIDALVQQDIELAASVVAKKDALHKMELKLEEHCYQLIATNQPVAKDMRTIVCTLKVINASMRIGRYGKVIANIVREIADKPHIAHMMSIPHMADLAIEMIDDAIKAYETDSLALIADFSTRDDTIDALRHSILREGITHMMENPRVITRVTHYIIAARYLERCADHACKIAESVHYMNTGERIEIH